MSTEEAALQESVNVSVQGTKQETEQKTEQWLPTEQGHLYGLDVESKVEYEKLLVGLNRELARLKSLHWECENKAVVCQKGNVEKLEDKDDIIIYLQRTIKERDEELTIFQKEKQELETTKNQRNREYEQKINDLNEIFDDMELTLTEEKTSWENKLNALENLSIERKIILNNFEKQEKAMFDQAARHKNELYELEKHYIIEKDKLQKQIKIHLKQLQEEFKVVTPLRLAAMTNRLIKENVKANNYLKNTLKVFTYRHKENKELKNINQQLAVNKELNDYQFDHLHQISIERLKIIDSLLDRLIFAIIVDTKNVKFMECVKGFQYKNKKLRQTTGILKENEYYKKCRQIVRSTTDHLETVYHYQMEENQKLNLMAARIRDKLIETLSLDDVKQKNVLLNMKLQLKSFTKLNNKDEYKLKMSQTAIFKAKPIFKNVNLQIDIKKTDDEYLKNLEKETGEQEEEEEEEEIEDDHVSYSVVGI